MKNYFKGGIRNPLAGHSANFNYEVLDLSEVKNVTFSDDEKNPEEPQRQFLLGTLTGGSKWSQEKYLCTLIGDDALKQLRQGDVISANLKFYVRENEDGLYEQIIYASDIYTLSDYSMIREAEARFQGSLDKPKSV